jgi:hypothetical protein
LFVHGIEKLPEKLIGALKAAASIDDQIITLFNLFFSKDAQFLEALRRPAWWLEFKARFGAARYHTLPAPQTPAWANPGAFLGPFRPRARRCVQLAKSPNREFKSAEPETRLF